MVRHSDTLCAISAGYYVVAGTTQQYQIKAETQVYTDKQEIISVADLFGASTESGSIIFLLLTKVKMFLIFTCKL